MTGVSCFYIPDFECYDPDEDDKELIDITLARPKIRENPDACLICMLDGLQAVITNIGATLIENKETLTYGSTLDINHALRLIHDGMYAGLLNFVKEFLGESRINKGLQDYNRIMGSD